MPGLNRATTSADQCVLIFDARAGCDISHTPADVRLAPESRPSPSAVVICTGSQIAEIKTDQVEVYERGLGPANLTAEGDAGFLKTNLSTTLGHRPDRHSGRSGTPITRFQNQQATVPQSARECGRPQTVLRGDSVEFPCRPLNVGLSPEAGFAL